MAKKESTFINMFLTLLIISGVGSVALAGVYLFTKEPIAIEQEKKLKQAIDLVVPGASAGEIEIKEVPVEGGAPLIFYNVKKDGKYIGTAVKTYSNNAFGGTMTVMVGFDEKGKIIDSDVLEHKETPGLGDKTAKVTSNWNTQFKGWDMSKQPFVVKKDGGQVDAITAATISSRAYCDALTRAYNSFMGSASDAQSGATGGNK